MITELYIRDYALISQLHIQLGPGFAVVTGETGAGKSIILGAIALLLGNRADTRSIKRGAAKCVIEAHFRLAGYGMEGFFADNGLDYDADDCIVRRELMASGKSRAFINDTPCALALLKELGSQLVDVHSQHQNLLLGQHDFQLQVVDIIARNSDLLARYKAAFADLRQQRQRLADLQRQIDEARSSSDYMQYQYDELERARLTDGEQEQLEQDVRRMEHAEDIKGALYSVSQALLSDGTGVVEQLRTSAQALRSIDGMLDGTAGMAERLDSAYIDMKDLAADVEAMQEDLHFDPAELDRLNSRLDLIYSLQQKYHADSVTALLRHQAELQQQLSRIENSDELLSELQQAVAVATQRCEELARQLSERRRQAAADIEHQMVQRLVPLGMPHVRFSVHIAGKELAADGADRVEMSFSANTSSAMQPVAAVASGGEIARVMLALKALISGAVKLPTIIFDEIDTGVSGKIAERMGTIMQEMAGAGRQVISITHLPQIAALGKRHYRVYKEETPAGTESHMTELTADERLTEIAQMLSGSEMTDAAIENARALLRK
ncbi:MAG: DNA repair protein RecN [Prevotella sp.]|nr:DNA repair protein RecN [Prevotella sp.]